MSGRYRFPIRSKLIAAAVALVAALTAGFVGVSGRVLAEAYEQQAARLQTERIETQQSRSVEVARNLSDSAREALAGNETGRIQRLLRRIVSGNDEILVAAIADAHGRVLVRSDMLVLDALEAGLEFAGTDPTGPVVAERTNRSGEIIRDVTHPIRAADGLLGFLQLSWSTASLREALGAIEMEKQRDVGRATRIMATAGLLAVAAGILAGVLGGLQLARPIRSLAATARAVAAGDLEARATVTTRDEIGELGRTMNHMTERIRALVDEARHTAELERELEVARGIQHSLLPDRQIIRRPGLRLCGLVEPASHVGGDWWAWMALTRQRTLVLVGDVTGHGLSSAMLTATARSCVDTVRQLTRADFRPGYLLKIMDQLLRESIGDDYHMTCFASLVDPIEGTLTYANAGHEHPYLLRKTETGWRKGRLSARGNRLGDADGHAFVEHTVNIEADDLLCWFTDGLVESVDPNGREYGGRRLRRVLESAVADPPDRTLDQILANVDEFRDGGALEDDVTCVIGRIVV